MADLLASALVETLLGNLTSAALKEIKLAWGLEDEVDGLTRNLGIIQSVLQDAEKKQGNNDPVQIWLKHLKHAAYDAQDILDKIPIVDSRRRRGMRHQLNSCFSLKNPLLCRLKIAHEVRNVRERIDAIAEEKNKFHLAESVTDNGVGGISESRETFSLVNEQEIVGRTEDKEKIIQALLGTTHDDEPFVYAIRGMGGLGKTTLAQLVYNDERTEMHFDSRIWVCVSDDFSIKRIVGEIIESIDQGGSKISSLDQMQRNLQEKLRGKRFLLVLDDVWNENDSLWGRLKEALRCGSQGSVVMVTTRNEKIATMMARISIHHLEFLSEVDSLSLFKQKAFANREENECLMKIGEAIVEKCGGVPLAIKAIGSLMQFKSSKEEWLAIKESEIWLLPDEKNGILPALRLSYDNLLPHMKQCFAYCCIFPKDYEMNEDELIELWMANGFLSSKEQKNLRQTGHWIFEELVWRSFFQDVNGKTCKMHDLVHDLACSVMKHETCIVEEGKVLETPEMLRHLSFQKCRGNNKVQMQSIAPNSLHSLIVHGYELPFKEEDLFSLISKQQHLRVLHLPYQARGYSRLLKKLICKLEHLRYLKMSCWGLERLPESLTYLLYLQTLKLTDSSDLQVLPKGLRHMKNLWFLDIEEHGKLRCMPAGMGELTCLQRLSIFIVGKDLGTRIDQLKELNLGGELSIRGLENVRNLEDAKSANLMRKENLTSLTLSWMEDPKEICMENFEEVLEGLQPYKNLKELTIQFYKGSSFPNWMSTLACENLTEISLRGCDNCERLPPFGKLSRLTLISMLNLGEWALPDSRESFPCLKYIEIDGCPKLKGFPALTALKYLHIKDSSVALVRSIVSLTSLRSICLDDFAELDVFPEGLLQDHKVLERLVIRELPKIKSLSNLLDNLSNLRALTIGGCSNLEFIPEALKHLYSLMALTIFRCDSLTSFPTTILQDLSSLRFLIFQDCKRLNALSGLPQRESALEDLRIFRCPEFKYLPESMQQFTSLRTLWIWDCQEFSSLPDDFGSLKSLEVLKINKCDPQLEKRCQKANGADWPKISHIPFININGQIQGSDL